MAGTASPEETGRRKDATFGQERLCLGRIPCGWRREAGFVLITMAASAIALIAVLGLAVDVGRMFIAKNEAQAYCDAAALAGALKLDGTTTGIANATTAAQNVPDKWNLNSTSVSSPAIQFGTSISGPWVSSPSPATGYTYVQVSANVPLALLFLPMVVAQSTSNITAHAIAAQVSTNTIPQGLAPYSAVSTNTTGPNFGMVVGNSYDVQWPQFNGSRAGCGPSNPARCFNTPPCSGDPVSSQLAVVNNWGSSNNGYWGSNSNSVIGQELLDNIQMQTVSVGTNIAPVLTNGNKNSEAIYLDQRASEDINGTDNTVPTYFADPNNLRRLIAVPIVDPTSATSTSVLGYGSFLIYTNGLPSNYYQKNTNGNSPFCAMYAGPYNAGGGVGTGGQNGATYVRLMQ